MPLPIIYSNTLVFYYDCSLLFTKHALFIELTMCKVFFLLLYVQSVYITYSVNSVKQALVLSLQMKKLKYREGH